MDEIKQTILFSLPSKMSLIRAISMNWTRKEVVHYAEYKKLNDFKQKNDANHIWQKKFK